MGKAEELAAAVEALGRKKRRSYPKELRQQVADYVRQQRATGVPLKGLSQALGISPTLLHRWELDCGGAFRRVELTPRVEHQDTWVLRAPRGVFVEGLTLESLTVVLRGLE